ARKLVFAGFFTAAAKLGVSGGRLAIEKEGKVKKLVAEVEQVSFSGRRGIAQGQDVTYITERCVMKLSPEGLVVTEIAPGVDLKAHVLDQADIPLKIAPQLKVMDDALFHPQAMGAKCHA